ncbi:hypothetical protein [Mucilaginibacter lappiensis]|uniref:Uncharacterized protein n=1 Tax=Mucilaginibacter lappiensis TaxID=354630 RepID=A0A841JQX0_9SPHI|nr:hypothetical protein [Mucilaginibacter lappiensis]MBB6131158.1 hypothetical protein [Mucilaginibacter lappiensis]
MKKIIMVFIYLSVGTCYGQAIDSASRQADSYFKEAAAAARNQHVWNAQIYGPMFFVDPKSRLTYANMPDSAGILKPDGPVYKGILPEEVIIANTAVHWEGRMWSVMLWPMLKDHDERVNLMMHESFHRMQAKIGLPELSPTIEHMSSMYGRIYFLLELKALEAALSKPLDQRSVDLTNALIFRQKRHELFPGTFKNERILEMSEGLAEYTGVILGRPKGSIRQHLYHQIDTAGQRKSLIRSCAIITGPVYGYLLYEKNPRWTLKVDSNSDFPLLIAEYYHIGLPKHESDIMIARLEKEYNGDAIIRSEKIKEEHRLQIVKQYIELFTQQPVLTITLQKMGISFNPNTLFDLSDYGTVYPTAEVKDTWGTLSVTANGMLMKDWKIITLPASEGLNINNRMIECNGWKINLNDGWKVSKVDALHYILTK